VRGVHKNEKTPPFGTTCFRQIGSGEVFYVARLEAQPSRIKSEVGAVLVWTTPEVALKALGKVRRVGEVQVLRNGRGCLVSEE